ncbi:hypothetical protein JCM10450v2_008009 [Rhodotorula kratochvilovae]
MPSELVATLTHFRDDLNVSAPPSTFRSYFTTSRPPVCLEHGPLGHAALPFLGEPFEGEERILRYYALIGSVLKGKGSTFDKADLLVHERAKGLARAVWTGEAVWSVAATGKEWHEAVVWLFDVEKEEGEWKIVRWEVWADTLSAYLASQP